jgi:glycosyltransferase involved in cell wall biosynthesis
MAAGLACVATAVGGSPEVLDDGACGVLVPPRRADRLRDALVALARNPAELARLGDLARRRIESSYAFSIVDSQYRALYEQLLSSGVRVARGEQIPD